MRVNEPKTKKGRRVLLAREPHMIEGSKQTILLQGRNSSETIRSLLNDIYVLKKPHAVKFVKKNDINAFEDIVPVEKFCRKFDSALFMLGCHSKKRPHNLIIGRMFDGILLDMIEFAITGYKAMQEFNVEKIFVGTKPCLLFSGTYWESNSDLKQARSLLTDIFHRETCQSVRFQGLEHMLQFIAASDDRILVRSYRTVFKKSSSQDAPKVELVEIGPRFDLLTRRSKLPSEDLWREALRQPKIKKKVKKNKSSDRLGTSYGRIHIGKQHTEKIQTRKMVGLKKHISVPSNESETK